MRRNQARIHGKMKALVFVDDGFTKYRMEILENSETERFTKRTMIKIEGAVRKAGPKVRKQMAQ